MPTPEIKHRPLASGLRIDVDRPSRAEDENPREMGTLTGIAYRGTAPVLVTAMHVIAGRTEFQSGRFTSYGWRNPLGDEQIYQGGPENKEFDAAYRVGNYTAAVKIAPGGTLDADVAIGLLRDGVEAAPKLHGVPAPYCDTGAGVRVRRLAA